MNTGTTLSRRRSAPILMAGTIAIDTIITPDATAEGVLGGSACFAASAARLFAEQIDILSIVGSDFPPDYWNELNGQKVNLEHVDHTDGPSFSWTGRYEKNMNVRTTVTARDDVMLDWKVRVPEPLKRHPVIVATCMVPERQVELISQCEAPSLVLSDSMDKWIARQPEWLDRVIALSDVTMMNENEAKAYARTNSPLEAGEYLLSKGATHAIIKQGEYGSILFTKNSTASGANAPLIFRCPAWPLRTLVDPTGAGDSFLGALTGYLATIPGLSPSFEDMKKGIIRATVAASFTCESFSADSLFAIDGDTFRKRLNEFLSIISIPPITD